MENGCCIDTYNECHSLSNVCGYCESDWNTIQFLSDGWIDQCVNSKSCFFFLASLPWLKTWAISCKYSLQVEAKYSWNVSIGLRERKKKKRICSRCPSKRQKSLSIRSFFSIRNDEACTEKLRLYTGLFYGWKRVKCSLLFEAKVWLLFIRGKK